MMEAGLSQSATNLTVLTMIVLKICLIVNLYLFMIHFHFIFALGSQRLRFCVGFQRGEGNIPRSVRASLGGQIVYGTGKRRRQGFRRVPGVTVPAVFTQASLELDGGA